MKCSPLTLLILASATSGVMSFVLFKTSQSSLSRFFVEQRQTCPRLGRRKQTTIPSLSSRNDESLTIMDEKEGEEDTATISVSTTTQEEQSLMYKSSSSSSTDGLPGLGLLVLCSVPLVWGTYVPIVRLLYEIDPPIPGFLFSAFYFFISAVTTVGLAQVLEDRNNSSQQASVMVDPANNQTKIEFMAGLELGSWLFMGNTLQLLGLKTVSSDRAGFLVQLTTILVPLLSAILAGNLLAVDGTTWIACLIALTGIVVMNVDLTNLATASGTSSIALDMGDELILAAAVMYSMHVIRLGKWAPMVPSIRLAASKSTVETILSVMLVFLCVAAANILGSSAQEGLVLGFFQESGKELISFFETVSQKVALGTLSQDSVVKAIGATLWAGWVGTAYVIWAQSFGQTRVGPSESNLIYSLQPIFTATFAYCLLGETMNASGFLGGGLILSAVLLVASKQNAGKSSSS